MSGENGYIAVYVEGTIQANRLRVNNNGNNITSSTFQALSDDYVTDSTNILIGKIKWIGIPFSAVSWVRQNISLSTQSYNL